MSFYTSFYYYRPGPPPVLTGPDLATFVAAFASLGLVDQSQGRIGYSVKFGRAIDQDERPSSWDEAITPGGVLSVSQSVEYDAENRGLPTLARLSEDLAKLDKTIYRADLSLGPVTHELFSQVAREPSEENDQSLLLDSWSMEIGPILSSCLGHEGQYMVGWIAVGLEGSGYLYPWTFRDLIHRAEFVPGIQSLMDLCRRTWPVAPDLPKRRVVKVRQSMGELWPYDHANMRWDWYWGLAEG